VAEAKQTPKVKVKTEEKPIAPKMDKPDGYKTVYFKYSGESQSYEGKTLISHVTPEIAEMYKNKMTKRKEKGLPCNILKVE
jgi:hypothetical protein